MSRLLVYSLFLSHDRLWIVVLALVFDGLTGDPPILWTRLAHPAVAMGRLISVLESRFNRPAKSETERRLAGIFTVAVLLSLAIATGVCLERLLRDSLLGSLVMAFLASVLLAQRSLYEHIADVGHAFKSGGLVEARIAVARVVGRDPDGLDEAAVCRAAIESCAENFSDGVAAPAFWFALAGLPGLIAYKIVNTADSMIGHRTPRFEAFGWASARLDDCLNLLPARLSGLLLSCAAPFAGGRAGQAFFIMWRDAGRHRSPNAGWPESAAAGALGLALGGPRQYAGKAVDEPFLNAEGAMAAPNDIPRVLRLLLAACGLEIVIYAVLALLA